MKLSGAHVPQELPLRLPEGAKEPSAPGGPSFSDRVGDFMEQVDKAQTEAESKSVSFAEGTQNDLHGTMMSVQRADVLLRLTATVRNRAIEAYREVMRMGA